MGFSCFFGTQFCFVEGKNGLRGPPGNVTFVIEDEFVCLFFYLSISLFSFNNFSRLHREELLKLVLLFMMFELFLLISDQVDHFLSLLFSHYQKINSFFFPLSSVVDDGVLEPGEFVEITNIVVESCGGLTLPGGICLQVLSSSANIQSTSPGVFVGQVNFVFLYFYFLSPK